MEEQPQANADAQLFVRELCDLLGETYDKPVHQIRQIVELCGVDFARELYNETLTTEDQGGLMLPDNSRRRTIGGVYFYLARKRISVEHRKLIFPSANNSAKAKVASPPPRLPDLIWDERHSIIEALVSESGGINSVKVTLIGRPGKIETRHDVVITTMSDVIKVPTLPKGVPPPPTTPTLYTVYIAAKQWRRIEESLANPEDSLIVEGVCVYDPEIKGMAVFASSAQSKLLEISRREQQKAAVGVESKVDVPPKPESAPPSNKPVRAVRSRIADSMPVPTAAQPVLAPPGMPPDAAQKLSELYASASLFRQKITNLKSKPAGQQGGLEMTQKLLKNVEDEIAALETKFSNK